MVGIAFCPAGFFKLFGVPMAAFTDQRIDLKVVLGNEAVLLENQILESSTHQQRINTIEQFLRNKLCRTSIRIDVVDNALSTILQRRGILSINQLSDDLCISPRQVRRRFTEKVGISPKLFSRIVRFNYISGLFSTAKASWTDMVQEGEYYDQAHFIRDFCDFSGRKPTELINYHRELAVLLGTKE